MDVLRILERNTTTLKLEESSTFTPNCWVQVVGPTEDEIKRIADMFQVTTHFVTSILDEEEQPRTDIENNMQLVIIDVPIRYVRKNMPHVKTSALGILITENAILTISTQHFDFLKEFEEDRIKDFSPEKKSRFLIQILYQLSTYYLKCLKVINQDIENAEDTMFQATKTKDLSKLLSLEKTLVYFTASLRENQTVLEKIRNGNVVMLYEEDLSLLDDAIIENKQGIEIANLYREILSSMTNSYGTVITNHLNTIMKFLAGITIVISIPTMVASFMGMNVPLGIFETSPYAFLLLLLLSLVISLIIAWILKKKNML